MGNCKQKNWTKTGVIAPQITIFNENQEKD